jgi:hypothetical protein
MKDSGETDKRHFSRVGICNLVTYVCIDENGECASNGIGNVFDVSQSGLRLETAQRVTTPYLSLMAIDISEQLIEIIGKVVRRGRTPSGGFNVGIELMGTREENMRFAASLVRAFHYGKKSCRPQSGSESAG